MKSILFRVVMPYIMWGKPDILEEHASFIFKVKE
jgi:hypothetical protein